MESGMLPRFVAPRGMALGAGLALLLAGAARLSAVQVDVDATQVVRTVDDRMFGLNTAVWDSAFNNAECSSAYHIDCAVQSRVVYRPFSMRSISFNSRSLKSVSVLVVFVCLFVII